MTVSTDPGKTGLGGLAISGAPQTWTDETARIAQARSFPLRKWATALGKMRNGERNAKVVMIGDSTTGGSGAAGSPGYTSGGRPYCPGFKLAKRMRDLGLTAYASGLYGPPAEGLSNASFKAWDARISGTGWGPQALPLTGAWLMAMSETTAAASFTFTPAENVDTFEIVYSTTPSSRVFSYAVDGGAATNVDVNAASGLATRTVSAGSVGSHSLTIAKVSGAANYIYGIRAYDSTTKCVEVMPWGISSRRAQDCVADTNPYDGLPLIRYFAPDLTVINLCINEWVNSGDVATFKTNLALIVTAAQVSGDVVIQTGVPTQITTTALAAQQPYVDAAIAVGVAAGATIDDTWRRFQSRERDTSIYTDYAHPNGAGYEFMVGNAARILVGQ